MKYSAKFKLFLIKMDKISEFDLKQGLFENIKYIDTPGSYIEEKRYYQGVIEYYQENMGEKDFKKLYEFYLKNTYRVNKLLKNN